MRKATFYIFIITLILAFCNPITNNTYAESSLSWENNKAFEVNQYRCVAYGAGKYVAVGDDGAISTSLDAKKWKTLPFQTTNGLKYVIWDGSKFVIVGDKGTVMTSSDGSKWKLNHTNVMTDFSYIVWAEDKYIAIANNRNELMESNDCLTWKSCVIDSSFAFGKIVYNGEFYVAIGGDPFSSDSYIYLSKDGTTWVLHYVGQFGKFTDIIFDNGVAIASANYVYPDENYRIITSSDCVTWKESSRASMLITGLCKMNDTFIYSMYNKIFASKDLITWIELNTSIDNEYINRFFKCNNKVFAIDNYSNNVLVSGDGKGWEYSISADSLTFNNIQWVNDHFVIVSTDGTYISQDGIEWKDEPDADWSYNDFNNCETANNGSVYLKVDIQGNLNYSKDLTHWIAQPLGENNLFTGVIWGGDRFLAFGSKGDGYNGIIYSSTDGIQWKEMITNTNSQIEAIAWNGMTYVAVGSNKTIITFTPTDKEAEAANDKWDGSYKTYMADDNGNIIWKEAGWNYSAVINTGKSSITTEGDRGVSTMTLTGISDTQLEGSLMAWNYKLTMNTDGSIKVLVNPGSTTWYEVWVKDDRVSQTSLNSDSNFNNIDYNKSQMIRVIINGSQIPFDVNPQIVGGRAMVPMRTIFEAFGLKVDWDNKTKTAQGEGEGNTVEFTIGSSKAITNGQEKTLDTPANIINGRTMIPLRFLSENLGYHVVWIEKSNLILISKADIIEWRPGGNEGIFPYKEYEVKYINGVAAGIRYTGY